MYLTSVRGLLIYVYAFLVIFFDILLFCWMFKLAMVTAYLSLKCQFSVLSSRTLYETIWQEIKFTDDESVLVQTSSFIHTAHKVKSSRNFRS